MSLALHEGILFSSAADGTAKAWDMHNDTCLATYEGHRREVWDVQVTGKTLVASGADGTVRFWDIETMQPLHVINLQLPVRAVAMVGNFLAAATSSADIQVVDLDGMKQHCMLQGHLLAVSALTSLDGGKRLVSGSHDTFVRIWSPRTGMCEAVLGGHSGTIGALSTITPPSIEVNRDVRPPEASGRESDHASLIISGSGDATVRVWGRDFAEGQRWSCLAVLQGHRHGVWAVHACSDVGIFASGGGDATVKVWAPILKDQLPGENADRLSEQNSSGEGDALETRWAVAGSRTPRWGQGWECVGGVRGTIGAVGAVLVTDEDLKFGTSEAMIASFPLRSCMPRGALRPR
ncbi:unnamed protein product [Sphacelaria rigidula]